MKECFQKRGKTPDEDLREKENLASIFFLKKCSNILCEEIETKKFKKEKSNINCQTFLLKMWENIFPHAKRK